MVKEFLFWSIVSVLLWALCHIHLSLSLPFPLSFFQVRSTVNRIKERRKALNFSVRNPLFSREWVCVCVHVPLSVWASLQHTGATDSIFLTAFASHGGKKNHYSRNANESWPQSNIVHLVASRSSTVHVRCPYTSNADPSVIAPPPSSHCPLQHLHPSNVKLRGGLQVSNPGQAVPWH